MNHRANDLLRSSFFREILFSCVLAAAVVALPSLAAAQAPAEPAPPPPDTSTTQTPSTNGGAQQTQPAEMPQQTGGQPAQGIHPNSTNTPKDLPPVPQQDNPKVKPGSEADVDAIGNRGVGKGVNFYSLEKEIALGKSLAQQVERSSKLVDDPVVTEYVNRVGQNLVRNSDAKVPFTIKVIDSDQINAFALPGGFFYVNSGLDSGGRLGSGTGGRDGPRDLARGGAPRHQECDQGRDRAAGDDSSDVLGPGGLAGLRLYEG